MSLIPERAVQLLKVARRFTDTRNTGEIHSLFRVLVRSEGSVSGVGNSFQGFYKEGILHSGQSILRVRAEALSGSFGFQPCCSCCTYFPL